MPVEVEVKSARSWKYSAVLPGWVTFSNALLQSRTWSRSSVESEDQRVEESEGREIVMMNGWGEETELTEWAELLLGCGVGGLRCLF